MRSRRCCVAPTGATFRRVRPEEVAAAIGVPIRGARDITPDALQVAIAGPGGYSFII